jgi:hypothetical protein
MSFPFYDERLLGYIKMHQGWCESQNIRRKTDFFSRLETWKHNAMFAFSKGQAVPDAPAVPMLLSVDEAKCAMRFADWETGLPQVFDFYVETPLAVPADAFKFRPDPIAAPADVDAVGDADGWQPGQWLVAQGYDNVDGYEFVHPVHGKLKFRKVASPFGFYKRWFKVF